MDNVVLLVILANVNSTEGCRRRERGDNGTSGICATAFCISQSKAPCVPSPIFSSSATNAHLLPIRTKPDIMQEIMNAIQSSAWANTSLLWKRLNQQTDMRWLSWARSVPRAPR